MPGSLPGLCSSPGKHGISSLIYLQSSLNSKPNKSTLHKLNPLRHLLLVLFLMSFSLHVQSQEDNVFRYKVKSEVTINGTSNVKKFSCTEITDFYENPHNIVESRNPGVFTYKNAEVDILVDNFDCKMGKMTKIMKKTLQSDKYPKVIIDILKIKFQDKRTTGLQNGDNINAEAEVTIAGKTQLYTIAFNNIEVKNELITFKGNLDLDMKAHDIDPPTVMGFIKVNQIINIDFILIFKEL